MVIQSNSYTVLVTYRDGSTVFATYVEADDGPTFNLADRARRDTYSDAERVRGMVEDASQWVACNTDDVKRVRSVEIVRADGRRDDCEV